uniref:Anthocyanin 5-aromatic acyltransferase-like n=1 Tax=Elaeis guineensis var. tenera TaxID=51953 RepID=A0A6I9R199_ELAGV|nr:anthocyanin 5-aromatic acyltransferase-like [Elaeis guineensis]
MASNSPALRVLENSRVSPPPGSVATASIPLTFFDVIWLMHYQPVERLFFYDFPHPTAHFIDSCLPNLKTSLSLTLQHFFPFAGNLRRSLGSDDRYEICYVDGDSVPFTVAEHDGDLMRGVASDRKAYLLFPVDCRGRLQPPLPAAYFGNCVGPCFVEVAVGDVIGEEGFVAAAEAIGKAIEGTKDGILDDAERWIRRLVPVLHELPMSVAGSPKFRVYETDFGWGGPQKVLVTSILGPGAISVAESKDEQGGIEIGMVLLKHVMDEFSARFWNGLKLLAK